MRSISFVRTVVVLAAALLLGGTLLSTPARSAPAQTATTERAPRVAACFPGCWGAISFNTATGVSGGRNDVNGKSTAIQGAIARCKEKNRRHQRACVSPAPREVYVQNGCLAVWYRVRGARVVEWARGKHFYLKRATRRAKVQLKGPGELRRSAHLCTTRRK